MLTISIAFSEFVDTAVYWRCWREKIKSFLQTGGWKCNSCLSVGVLTELGEKKKQNPKIKKILAHQQVTPDPLLFVALFGCLKKEDNLFRKTLNSSVYKSFWQRMTAQNEFELKKIERGGRTIKSNVKWLLFCECWNPICQADNVYHCNYYYSHLFKWASLLAKKNSQTIPLWC